LSEIKTDLDLLYGENALSYCKIFRWGSIVKGCITKVKDNSRPGLPISATFGNNQ
jgi:hypothetical protein